MKIPTSILQIDASFYVRVPKEMANYFGLFDIKNKGECKIEDKGQNKAEITFKKG